MKQIIKLTTVTILFILTSCQNEETHSTLPNEDIFIENINNSGLNISISPLNAPSTKNANDTESFLITIDNPTTKAEGTFESVLTVTRISDTKTISQHKTLDGITLGTYVCDNDDLVFIEVPDDYEYTATTSSTWFARWKRCVKDRYKVMMEIIRSDEELKAISDLSNGISGTFGVFQYITEAEVAIAAGIWCADSENNANY